MLCSSVNHRILRPGVGRTVIQTYEELRSLVEQWGNVTEPPYKEDDAHVYRTGTAIADIVEAMLKPSDSGDQRLRETSGGEVADPLKRSRQLACD